MKCVREGLTDHTKSAGLLPTSISNVSSRLFMVCLLSLAACRAGGGQTEGAGSDIGRLPVIESEPSVRLGGAAATGPTMFVTAVDIAVGPDGNVYVVDATPPHIRVFDQDGTALRTFGTKGRGPGEFQAVRAAGFVGDTLWLTDPNQRRTTFFTPSGGVIVSRSDTIRIGEYGSPALPVAYLAGNATLYAGSLPRPDLALDARAPVLLARGAESVTDTVIFRRAWHDWINLANVSRLRVRVPHNDPLLAVGPAGNVFAVVHREEDGVTAEIRSASGEVTRAAKLSSLPWQPTSPSLRDSVIRGALATIERVLQQLPRLREDLPDPEGVVRASIDLPPALSMVENATLSEGRLLWLRLREESTQTWLALDAELEPRATVLFPIDFDFRAFSNGRAWGFQRDSLDVTYVVAFDVDLSSFAISDLDRRSLQDR